MPVQFVVTGFGPFAGVQRNPTSALVEWLAGRTREPGWAGRAARRYSLSECDCTTLEVSASAAATFLEAQAPRVAAATPTSPLVLVHLGVDTHRGALQLETRAYNNATFRCADEAGYTPCGVLFEESQDLSSTRRTRLQLPALAAGLAAAGFDVRVSHDAGRFVCNCIYFLSLALTAAAEDGDGRNERIASAAALLQRVQVQAQQQRQTQTASPGQQQHPQQPLPGGDSSAASDGSGGESGSRSGGSGSSSSHWPPESSTTQTAAAAVAAAQVCAHGTHSCGGSSDSAAASGPLACAHSLFVHVPSFNDVPEQQQRDFLLALLDAIAAHLSDAAEVQCPVDPDQLM